MSRVLSPLDANVPTCFVDLIEARMFYDWNTDQLMEEAVRSSESSPSWSFDWIGVDSFLAPKIVQRQLSAATTMRIGRTKSVYQQRNLGTIKARKIQKKQAQSTSGDMILRILRMRFVSHLILR